jgi:MoaA/NifB/PqqE/SkfB family radical SAM enzyme
MFYNLYKLLPESLQRMTVAFFKNVHSYTYRHRTKKPYFSGVIDQQTFDSFNLQRKYGPRKRMCYAPYTSMFFSRAGYMSPCYATYHENSDKWPDTSIEHAWFKGELSKVREHIALNDLDYSCNFCKPFFLSKNFGSLLLNKYEPYSFGKSKYPQIMEFELSSRCSLECIMCDGNLSMAIRKNREKLESYAEVYDQRFVNELKPFIPHLKMAEFTGGDPFLIPIYYEIWDLIHEINPKCQILITTNANTMTPRIENMLEKFTNLHFNISIDSLDRTHYEQIRVNANYDKVLENMLRFINYCRKHKNSCNLLVCPMTINSHDLAALIEFANAHHICVYFHTVVKPTHLSLKYQSQAYLNELIIYLKKFNFRTKKTSEKTNTLNYQNLIKLLESWSVLNETENTKKQAENSVDILYKKILRQNNPEILKKTELLSNYFDAHKQTDEMINVLNLSDSDFLYQIIQNKSVDDLIIFVKQELEKKLTPEK